MDDSQLEIAVEIPRTKLNKNRQVEDEIRLRH